MSTASIRLYDIFRKSFKLSETEAQEAVQVIENVSKEQGTDKHQHTVEVIHKDMQALKDYMDIKIESIKEYMDIKFATKDDLATSRTDLIKWMFLFWVGQVAATFGFILLFLKK